MLPASREGLDKRIVASWRAGLRSPAAIGRRVGLDRMHVGRRIARMVKARSWPFEPPPRGGRAAASASQESVGAVPGLRPSIRAEPGVTAFAPLSLRIRIELHARLRVYCRVTGATVSEAVAEALEGFLPPRPRA